ncbi:MAG: discoidin domain-containing protein, partial [Bacteroidota bacterium]
MTKIYILLLLIPFTISVHAQCFVDRHNTTATNGWISCQKNMNPINQFGNSHWIRYDFGEAFPLHHIEIWNTSHPNFIKGGIKDAVISTSLDGTNWTHSDTISIPMGKLSSFYEGNIVYNLNGINAQYLLITAINNHGGDCTGFSEIRIHTNSITPDEFSLDFSPCENAGTYKNLSGFFNLNGVYSGTGVS